MIYSLFVASQTFAQAVPQATPEKPIVDITEDRIKDLPLGARRDKVVEGLRTVTFQIGSFITRTQLVVDRLHEKGLATGQAQLELTQALTDITLAKTKIDAIATVAIPEQNQESTAVSLKNSLSTTQETLKSSRNHLVAALSNIKIVLNTTDIGL